MKKLCSLLAAICMSAAVLAGCGSSSATAPAEIPQGSQESSESTEPVSEAMPLAEQIPALANMVLTNAYPFSEGLAWVQYTSAAGSVVTSVVDEQGNLVFSLESGLNPIYMSPFQDGYAFYSVKNDDGASYDVIVDKTGIECYRTDKDAPENVRQESILCYGNGVFATARDTTGIESAGFSFGSIKADGTVVDAYTKNFTLKNDEYWNDLGDCVDTIRYYMEEEHGHAHPSRYFGEGWYLCGTSFLRFTDHTVLPSYDGDRRSAFENGNTASSDGFEIQIYDADLNPTRTVKAAMPSWGNYPLIIKKGTFFSYADNNFNGAGYYSLAEGSLILPVTQYPDNFKYCTPFFDGFAIMMINGADNQPYVTVIDENAKEQFEPLVYSDKVYPELVDGCLIANVGGWSLIDTKGQTVHSISGDFPGCSKLSFRNGGDGFLLVSYVGSDYTNYLKYYSVADAIAAGSSVYDVGALTPADISHTAPESGTTPEYITMSDFSIEGKWQSVGVYGFGQAQPGAIVAFDGTHCNFFSPSDTYALIASGDGYELDVTSFGSTDSLSFTVGIVDENHIDLIGSGGTTQLARVG